MKYKEIQKLSKEDREKKLKELKMELVKANADSVKGVSSKAKNIKKIIAKINTLLFSEKKGVKNK